MQVQRMQLKGIARLSLTPAQSTQHAADWQRWVRRRKALTRNLLECMKRMNSALPTASYLRDVIIAVNPEVLSSTAEDADRATPSLRADRRDDATVRNISHSQQANDPMRCREAVRETRKEASSFTTTYSDIEEGGIGSQDISQRSRYIYVLRKADSASERSTAPFNREAAETAAAAAGSVSRSAQGPETKGGLEPSPSISKSSALGGQANTTFSGSSGSEFQKRQAQGVHQEVFKVQKRDTEDEQTLAQQTQEQVATCSRVSLDTHTQDVQGGFSKGGFSQGGLAQGGVAGFLTPLVQPQGVVPGGAVSATGAASGSVPGSVPGSAALVSALQQGSPQPGTGAVQGTFAGAAEGAGAGTSAGTAAGTAAGTSTGITAGATARTSAGATASAATGTVAGTSAGTAAGTEVGTSAGTAARPSVGSAVGTSSATHPAAAAPAFSARQPHVPSPTVAPPALHPTTAANVSRPALSCHPINTEDSDLVDLEISSPDQNLSNASRSSSSSSIPAADAPQSSNAGNDQRHGQTGDPNAAQNTDPMHETHPIQADAETRTLAAATPTQETDDDDIGLQNLFNTACMQMEALCIEPAPDDGTLLMASRVMHGNSDLKEIQKRFLGENGVDAGVVENALHELRSLLKDDAMLISETCAPLWIHMTPVRILACFYIPNQH